VSEQRRWDAGEKLFASRVHPDLFGFYGEVLYPTQILSQIVSLSDSGVLFSDDDDPEQRHIKIKEVAKSSFTRHDAPEKNFHIIHATRENSGMDAKFLIWHLRYWSNSHTWVDRVIDIPTNNSALVSVGGPGSISMEAFDERWRNLPEGRTSRAIFSAFCDSLDSGEDQNTGGPPQLIGLYRIKTPRVFGIVYNGSRFFDGLPLPDEIRAGTIEWRDRLFQRLDGETLSFVPGAKHHSRPVFG
jgi:hypothetical protein